MKAVSVKFDRFGRERQVQVRSGVVDVLNRACLSVGTAQTQACRCSGFWCGGR
jgi:hypothetical protein